MDSSRSATEKSDYLEIISAGAFGMLTDAPMKRETLQDWVNRKLKETGYSHQKVSDRAKSRGYKLSTGYVNNLAQGDADNPSAKLMKGLAAGFGVPLEEVIRVVFGVAPLEEDKEFWASDVARLWTAYKSLPPDIQRQKRPLLEMVIREINRDV